MRKTRIRYYLHKVVYYIGWIAIFLLAIALVMAGYVKLDQALAHQQLNHGYVAEKSYNDGHYWYSSYVFGDISITKRYGGEPYFYIEVRDGDRKDFWTVSDAEWDAIEVGDYVCR